MEYLSLNGKIRRADRARIAVTDPAVAIGYGLFEVTRAYHGVPFRLRDHLARMKRSARHFHLKFPFAPEFIDDQIRELCRRNRLPDAYVRVTLTAGGSRILRTRPLEKIPAAWYEKGTRILLSEFRRDPAGPLYGHKTLNYLENVLTRERARSLGAADSIFLGPRGEILEGCVTNVFLVRRGRLVTPSLANRILPGVTRKVVLDLAAKAGIRVEERAVRASELREADEVFLTNALLEVLPITRLGTERIGEIGPITRRLHEAYRRKVEAECGPDRILGTSGIPS